jgi:hypothetical protein
MRNFCSSLLCLVFAWLSAESSVAEARVTFVGHPYGPTKISCNIRIEGTITDSDALDMSKVIRSLPTGEASGVTVCLNSPGGSYEAALNIARLLLDRGISTAIHDRSQCYSACALIFMAGSIWEEIGVNPSRAEHWW